MGRGREERCSTGNLNASEVGTYIPRARPVLARAHAEMSPELPAEIVRGAEADLSGDGAYVVDRVFQEPGGLVQAEPEHSTHHRFACFLLEEVG
jgi:hypothetical protein